MSLLQLLPSTPLEWLIAVLAILLVAAVVLYVVTSLLEVEGAEVLELATELLD